MRQSVAFIINPVSGGVRPDVARGRAELASAVVDRHGDSADIFVTERAGHARELTQAALSRGARLVMAWGGDGTINEVASALAFGEVPLGIVPAGSGNGLAHQLGVHAAPERAIREAITAEPRLIDVGEMNDRLFVNAAGIGLDAHVAARFNDATNRRRGLSTYLRLGAGALLTYVPRTYTILTGDERLVVRAVLVTAANSAEFGNGICIAPGATVDDGLLDLVVVEERSRLRTLCQLPRLLNGSIRKAPGCSIRSIARATVECDEAMGYHVDGEPVAGGRRIRIRIHPHALHVCVKAG